MIVVEKPLIQRQIVAEYQTLILNVPYSLA